MEGFGKFDGLVYYIKPAETTPAPVATATPSSGEVSCNGFYDGGTTALTQTSFNQNGNGFVLASYHPPVPQTARLKSAFTECVEYVRDQYPALRKTTSGWGFAGTWSDKARTAAYTVYKADTSKGASLGINVGDVVV